MATLRDFVYGRYKRTDDLALSPSGGFVSFTEGSTRDYVMDNAHTQFLFRS